MFFRLHRCTQCMGAAYYYKCIRSVVCVFVCLSVCWAHVFAVQTRLNRPRCRLGADSCGPENHVDMYSMGGPDFSREGALLSGDMCRPL